MKTVYTAIFGKYDDLKDPLIITPGWNYICFTDQPLRSNVWKIVQRPMLPEGSQRTARYYKIMFHRHIETEESLWIDASFQINVDLNKWWEHFRSPVTCIKHPVRNCVYLEAAACVKFNKDAHRLIWKQVDLYEKLGLPEKNGMISSGILMRNMDQRVIDLCDIWYQQLQLHSVRDQISFAYASWQIPIHHTFSWDYRTGKEFIYINHLHKRKKV